MFTNQLALISQSARVPFSQLAKISAAIQKQITRDFTPVWKIPTSIDAFENLGDVPPGYWPIIIRDNIGFSALGIHLDSNGQPYALVMAGSNVSLTCSHEAMEMLADPFGKRFVASQSIMPGQGRVKYLVEVCDPSEAEAFAYTINGVVVSDFYTPQYFDPIMNPAVRYSFTGAIKAPRQVLKGGYLSWMLPETMEWFQATFFGPKLTFKKLGKLTMSGGKSWREIIDASTTEPVKKIFAPKEKVSAAALLSTAFSTPVIQRASSAWAVQLEADIAALEMS